MYCDVYFTDQVRAFGSGYRIVEVSIGRKWVHLKTIAVDAHYALKGKVSIKEWKQLERKARFIDEAAIKRGLRKAKKMLRSK